MKKILLLTENFPPIDGGSGRWFWELYSRLPRESIYILTHNVEGGEEFDKSHNLNVIRRDMSSPEWGLKSIVGLKFYWRLVKQVIKVAKQYKIDEIHCGRVIHEGVIARVVKLLTGIPFTCFVHGEDVETAATSREQSLMVKEVCRRTENLICNSENSRNLVEKLGFSSKSKCVVLHPGVDIDKFKPADKDDEFRKSMGWERRVVLLTVGRLQQRKGQDFMIEAMPELLKSFPNLFYAVVGRGECESVLSKKITELGLTESIKIYTSLDDQELIKCYQQCDLFILPNRTIGNDIEGFGMVLVEAQACGKPVIAGNSGGTAETMIVGQTGEIIDCSTSESLRSSLITVLRNEKIFAYGDEGVAHVRQSLNWEAHVQLAKAVFYK